MRVGGWWTSWRVVIIIRISTVPVGSWLTWVIHLCIGPKLFVLVWYTSITRLYLSDGVLTFLDGRVPALVRVPVSGQAAGHIGHMAVARLADMIEAELL